MFRFLVLVFLLAACGDSDRTPKCNAGGGSPSVDAPWHHDRHCAGGPDDDCYWDASSIR